MADLNEHQEWQDSHFSPKEYFRCHNLNHHVEKIDVSLKWKDQVPKYLEIVYLPIKYFWSAINYFSSVHFF